MDDEPRKPRNTVKVWLAILSTVAAGIAIVPPTITAFRASPTSSQSGTGNVAVVGSTVGSNNQTLNETHNTFLSMWVEGARTIVGAQPKAVLVQPVQAAQLAPQPPQAQAAATPVALSMAEPATPEPGTVGRLVDNASLMNDATWSPISSRGTRLLSFIFRVEATVDEGKQGTLDATLAREGRDVCTVSLNTQTSPFNSGVRWGIATCADRLPADAAASYHVRVKAVELVPVTVRLVSVDGVKG
jgi:hypothetical protein